MSKEILLIAEQDEYGRVIAVWRKMPNEKTARPLKYRDDFDDSEAISYHGAAEAEIVTHIEALPAATGCTYR